MPTTVQKNAKIIGSMISRVVFLRFLIYLSRRGLVIDQQFIQAIRVEFPASPGQERLAALFATMIPVLRDECSPGLLRLDRLKVMV
jgi:hypothetical protein